jgi:hypothetical protein
MTTSVTETSLPVTVTLAPGVVGRLDTWMESIRDLMAKEHEATTYEELAEARRTTSTAQYELLSILVARLRTYPRDGEQLNLFPDAWGPGIGFTYPESGYTGLIHVDYRGKRPTWSSHT